MKNYIFGQQLAKGTQERTYGTRERVFAGRNCGPHGPDGPALTRNQPAVERWACFRAARGCSPQSSGGLAFEQREDAALRPGAAPGCYGSLSEPQMKNAAFRLQPAECTHVRVRTAGLRRAEAAARTTSTEVDSSRKISSQPSGWAVRADLRDASCSPSPGGGCELLRHKGRKLKMKNERLNECSESGRGLRRTHTSRRE